VKKANGSLRPIGAPNLKWKLYQTALNFFIMNWIENKIGNYQHGYLPKRNGADALLKIMDIIDER